MKNMWRSVGPVAVLIVVLTVVVYLPALRGGFVWDDHNNITDNQLMRSLGGLKKTWVDPRATFQYYPLTYTVFWVEHYLWGMRPFGYHAVNVVLHALNALLVGILLTRLAVPGAWLAALLFAVHPVQVESVAWITELKNVLSGFLFLSALLAFLQFRWGDGKHRWWFYCCSLVLFLCSLLSKTSTVVLPVAVLLVLWWKTGRVERRDLVLLIPFVLIGVALASLTVWVEKYHVHAEGPEWQLSLLERCLLAGRVMWFSAGKFIWPNPLMFVYPRWRIDAGVWWQYLFPTAAIVVLLILWVLRKRTGKGPLVAAVFFVATTAPVSAAFDLYFSRYSYVADHFYYLASIGFVALAGAAIYRVMPGTKSQLRAAMVIGTILGALSWQHCKVFRNDETLWRDALAKNPDAWLAHVNLGLALVQTGKTDEAVGHWMQALRIKPGGGEAHNNLGVIAWQAGRKQEAIEHWQQAIRDQPDYSEALNNLGVAFLQQGEPREAIRYCERALWSKPYYIEAHYNLACALEQEGRFREAVVHYEQLLQLKPDSPAVRDKLARLRVGR